MAVLCPKNALKVTNGLVLNPLRSMQWQPRLYDTVTSTIITFIWDVCLKRIKIISNYETHDKTADSFKAKQNKYKRFSSLVFVYLHKEGLKALCIYYTIWQHLGANMECTELSNFYHTKTAFVPSSLPPLSPHSLEYRAVPFLFSFIFLPSVSFTPLHLFSKC